MLAGRPNGGEHRRDGHNDDHRNADGSVRRPSPMAKPSQQLTGLTDREVEVLTLVARGWSNQEISESLYVTSATTKTHVSRLLMKLGARDRAQLIVIAYETGLVSAG